jgi:hypothetical protein
MLGPALEGSRRAYLPPPWPRLFGCQRHSFVRDEQNGDGFDTRVSSLLQQAGRDSWFMVRREILMRYIDLRFGTSLLVIARKV